jgi:hypothetical protein
VTSQSPVRYTSHSLATGGLINTSELKVVSRHETEEAMDLSSSVIENVCQKIKRNSMTLLHLLKNSLE